MCTCKNGYRGDGFECNEIDDCENGPCQNGGNCTDIGLGFECSCTIEFSGDRCTIDVDECALDTHTCHEHADCVNHAGGYDCTCKIGYTGNGTICSLETDKIMSQDVDITTAALAGGIGGGIFIIILVTVLVVMRKRKQKGTKIKPLGENK